MADFSIWHVLPMGEMPTVRQVLECGGGRWQHFPSGLPTNVGIDDDGAVVWLDRGGWQMLVTWGQRLGVMDPRPLSQRYPSPERVGESSRWRIICAHKPEGDACTMRTVDGQIEALFDGDDQWVPIASQWGAGMVAIKEASCTSE